MAKIGEGGGVWDGTLLLHFLLSHFSKSRKNFPRNPFGVGTRVWETCFSPYHPARPALIYLEILFWRIKNEYHSIKCFIKEYGKLVSPLTTLPDLS